MAKRGRKAAGRVHTSLKECLLEAPDGTGVPYRVDYREERYFVVATSSSNAIRFVAMHLGFYGTPVKAQEIVAAFVTKV